MKINTLVKFRLDGNWYGEGLFAGTVSNGMIVILTESCKEFPKGTKILIGFDEVIN